MIEDFLKEKYADKKVLVLGIGGGGDIVGSIPVALTLQELGATPILGGLTWKRHSQDGHGRPIRKEEFFNTGNGNELTWYVNPNTQLEDGTKHVESYIAEYTPFPVIAINIQYGVQETYTDLNAFCKDESIEGIIGVDVGGDVLAYGTEPTLRSPICDQISLAVLSRIPNSTLAVSGFGTDGELKHTALTQRFKHLHQQNAYLGSQAFNQDHLEYLHTLLQRDEIQTECSRLLVDTGLQYTQSQRDDIAATLNKDPIAYLEHLNAANQAIRSGTRTAELSPLTTQTIYFTPSDVLKTNTFADYINKGTIHNIQREMNNQGIITELDPTG